MHNHVVLFIIAVLIGITGAIFGMSYWLVIGIIVGLTLLSISYFFYTMFISQNLKAIESVLRNNRKDPHYGYIVSVKDNNMEEAIAQLDQIISKTKMATQKHQYGIIREILAENLEAARLHAKEIEDNEIGKYSLALLDSMEGKGEQHLHTIYTKPWMSSAIRATHYLIKGDREQYETHRDIAISLSKGVQYAVTIYNFRHNEGKYVITNENSTATSL